MMRWLWFLLWLVASLWGQSKPLIMEHADSLHAERGRGYLLLQGNVRFVHDSAKFRTQTAIWNRDQDIVHCSGGFQFLHPKGNIKAKTGEYRRKDQIAEAMGSVEAHDSSGEAAFFGERLIYHRKTEFLDLPNAPVMHRYMKDSSTKKIDTLVIRARRITYDRNKDFAIAYGSVRIIKGDLIVTSDTGWFDRKKDQMVLVGRPRCTLKGYVLTGDSMHIVIAKEKLKSVRVVRNGHGTQYEKPLKGEPGRHTEVFGDTLYAEFDNDKMKHLRVTVGAKGLFWDLDLVDYINTMNGSRLVMDFLDGKMQTALVQGDARSSYWYTEKTRKVSGRNEAMGDTIHVSFDNNKVQRLRVKGNSANGVFYDLSKAKGAKIDSTLRK